MNNDSLTITDNRTGKTYEVPITYGTYEGDGASIRSADLRQIKVNEEDFGLMGYDPAYLNTASCKSSVTYIDGDAGILRYRGYPIEQLANESNYLETAYLLLNGELPNAAEQKEWEETIAGHAMVHESIRNFLDGFRWGSHTMGMLVSVLGAKSTFYPDSRDMASVEMMDLHISRLVRNTVQTLVVFEVISS